MVCLIKRSPDRQRGHTLLELIMAMTITSSVMVSFVLIYPTTASQAANTDSHVNNSSIARRALAEIEQCIRLSHQIHSASADRFEVSTRYFVDLDSDVERILYTRSAGNLYRQVADNNSTVYGKTELILEDVSSFSCHSLEIWDDFKRTDYGSDAVTAPVGDVKAVSLDASSKTKYKVSDFSAMDSDLKTHYDEDFERIRIANSGATNQSVTVTPYMRKQGLRIAADFTPEAKAVNYHAIVYGDETAALDHVSVVFKADNTIEIQSVVGGATYDNEVFSTRPWAPLNNYKVIMEFTGDSARAWVQEGKNLYEIGQVKTATTLDDKAVHLLSKDGTGLAAWNSVNIEYPYIEIQMVVNIGDTEILDLMGGATRRSKQ